MLPLVVVLIPKPQSAAHWMEAPKRPESQQQANQAFHHRNLFSSRHEDGSVVSVCPRPGSRRPSILHRATGDSHFGTRFQVAYANTSSHQRARALSLEAPSGDLTMLVHHIHEQPGVRVRVLKFFYYAH